MIRVLVWKELREQYVVWLLLALAAIGSLVGLRMMLLDSRQTAEILGGLLMAATWGYGMVCGALLFANETEEGTQTFLDVLPVRRRDLWQIKALTGVAFVMGFEAAMFAAAYFGLQSDAVTSDFVVGAVVGMLVCGLWGFVWGIYCGANSKNVLGSLGRALGLQLLWYMLTAFVVTVIGEAVVDFFELRWVRSREEFLALAVFCVFLRTAWQARRNYCRLDRERTDVLLTTIGPRSHSSWASLFWLTWRQSRVFFASMLAISLACAIALVVGGAIVWPILSLLLGLLCGVTVFANEQETGAFRFLGEQRYPLWRIWLVKFAMGVAAALIPLAVMGITIVLTLATSSLAGTSRDFAERLFVHLSSGNLVGLIVDPLQFALIWVVYGFAVGLLCGLLFRKPLVAAILAVGIAGPLVALWVPSLVGGSLASWQVAVPALVLIAASYWVLRPWAGDRLVSWRGIGTPLFALGLACVCIALSLCDRVFGVPMVAEPVDVASFVATLPTFEDNEAGRNVRSGLKRLEEIERKSSVDVANAPRGPQDLPGQRPGAVQQPRNFFFFLNQAQAVLQDEMPLRGQLGAWLDFMFQDQWVKKLESAVDLPVGIAFDPRDDELIDEVFDHTGVTFNATTLLMVRGLQEQERGHPEAFVARMRTALAVIRNTRYNSTSISLNASRNAERSSELGILRWVERLDGRPELLREALTLWREFESEPAIDPRETRNADYLTAVNTLNDPQRLLQIRFRSAIEERTAQIKVDLVRFCWQVPWERARLLRLVDWLVSEQETPPRDLLPQMLQFLEVLHRNFRPGRTDDVIRHATADLRATLLLLALRLYAVEVGKPAQKLSDLVPKYLSTIPIDPFDGEPFRYRLSNGETLIYPAKRPFDEEGNAVIPSGPEPETEPTLDVPAGWGIVWSVGHDKKDDGGKRSEVVATSTTKSRGDLIYLVPPPKKR